MNQLSLQALRSAKIEYSESQQIFQVFLAGKNIHPDQADLSFYNFILKKALFIKELAAIYPNTDLFDQIISDLIDIIRYGSLKDYRPYYLSVRSFEENFVRLLENKPLSDDHITKDVIEKFHTDFKYELSSGRTQDGYDFFMSEYRNSSTIVHYHRTEKREIATITVLFRDILTQKNISTKFRRGLYDRFVRLYKLLEKCMISKFPEQIASVFIRRNSTLEWLIGPDRLNSIMVKVNQ